MGLVYSGVPTPLARALVDGLGLRVAIETGTNLGESTLALSEMVDRVWTVELSPKYVEWARARHAGAPAITVLEGNSAAVLAGLSPSIDRPALYWLDAHWCAGDSAGHEAQCPLLGEIDALDTSPAAAESAILIDDASFFLACPYADYRRSDWPTFLEVADRLRARHPRYVTTLLDVIIATPPAGRAVVERFWQAKRDADMERARERTRQAEEALRARFHPHGEA
ncbi:MAG: hypothetical protein ABSH07_01670 [Candidatus Dormibacteria bacterium]|jgi:hypothetical protein